MKKRRRAQMHYNPASFRGNFFGGLEDVAAIPRGFDIAEDAPVG